MAPWLGHAELMVHQELVSIGPDLLTLRTWKHPTNYFLPMRDYNCIVSANRNNALIFYTCITNDLGIRPTGRARAVP